MKRIVLFILLLGSSSLFAQVKETRSVDDFNKVKSSQSIRVEFTYGAPKNVVIDADDEELLKLVKTEVDSNGQLSIYIDNKRTKEKKNKKKFVFNNVSFNNVTVYISNPVLEGVQVSSSSRFNLVNAAKAKDFYVKTSSSARYSGELMQTDNLKIVTSSSSSASGSFEVINKADISSSSSSSLDISLKTNKADFSASSSSVIKVNGEAKDTGATVSSSARIKGDAFKTQYLDGKASSSGAMIFEVSDEVTGKASSSGRIQYTGSAQRINVSTSSSGSVKKVN